MKLAKNSLTHCVLLFLVPCIGSALATDFGVYPNAPGDITSVVTRTSCYVPMRDDVRLAADLATASYGGDGKAAADWPRWMGRRGDGVAGAGGVFGGDVELVEAWRRPLGSGYSSVSVAGGRAVTMAADTGEDQVLAFDAGTGKDLWQFSMGPTFLGRDGSHDGPISTPTLDGKRVFAVGAAGELFALGAEDGKLLWSVDLVADFGIEVPFYGFAASPLVDGSRVVVLAGGKEENNLLAFDKGSGELAWSAAHGSYGSYASPKLATLCGVRQIVAPAGDRVYAVRPEDGSLLWSFDEPAFASLAVLPGDRVLVIHYTSAVMVQVRCDGEAWSAEALWRLSSFKSRYAPAVYVNGGLFAFDGPSLVCLDAASGEVRWRKRLSKGSLMAVGSHLLALGRDSGTIRVVEASVEGFRSPWSVPVFTEGAMSYTPPSFADGRVFARNLEEIVAFEVRKGRGQAALEGNR